MHDARDIYRAFGMINFHHFHHKFAVLDGHTLINGSYNWTRGADRNNRENFMRTGDPVLVQAYRKAFDALWDEMSP